MKKLKKLFSFIIALLIIFSTFQISSLAEQSEIVSIEIEDTSIIEGFNCENGIYYLCKPHYKVKLKDGREIYCDYSSGSFYDFEGNMHSLSTNELELQKAQKWELGKTYKVTGNLDGLSSSFNVTVKENPIKNFEIHGIEFLENTGGYYKSDENGNMYHYYSIDYPELYSHVELIDGSVIESKVFRYSPLAGGGPKGIYIDSQFYSICNLENDQDKEHWGVGIHKATAELLGMKTEFNVNIIENPIVDVKIKDVDIFKQLEDSPYSYYFDSMADITYSNGEKLQTPLNRLQISGYYNGIENKYISTSYFTDFISQDCSAGNYDWYVTINGKDYPFKLNVYDDEIIKSIECIKFPFNIEYHNYNRGETNLKGAKFRINYSDKSSEEVTIESDSEFLDGSYIYLKKLKKIFNLASALNNGNLEISLGKVKTEIPVTLKKNNIKNFEFKLMDNRNLFFVITYDDNTKIEKRISNVKVYAGSYDETSKLYTTHGVLFKTETEYFWGDIVFNENYFYATMSIGEKKYKTNVLYGYNFFNSPFSPYNSFQYTYGSSICGLKHFSGEITSENIDKIIQKSILEQRMTSPIKITYTKREIEKIVNKNFAVKDFDITLSKFYDPKNDTYIYDGRYIDSFRNSGYLLEANYVNGKYKLKYFYYDNEKTGIFYMTLTDDLRIIDINYDYISGDLDGDEGITDSDVLYLLKHTFRPEKYPVNQPCDYDGDGMVTDADAVYLLKHIFRPDKYPLGK